MQIEPALAAEPGAQLRQPHRIVGVEPLACPSLTKGELRYDFGDTAETTPLLMMYTLGHTFMPPSIHAGGLRYHGMARELTPQDLIALQQQGLSPNVIRAMQEMPPPQVVVAQPAPPPVIVDEWGYYHYPPRWGYYAPPPRVGVGFTFH